MPRAWYLLYTMWKLKYFRSYLSSGTATDTLNHVTPGLFDFDSVRDAARRLILMSLQCWSWKGNPQCNTTLKYDILGHIFCSCNAGDSRRPYRCVLLLCLSALFGYALWTISSFGYHFLVVYDPSRLSPNGLRVCNSCNHPKIPKILHHTWVNDTIPERWKPTYQSCKESHSDSTHMLWTNENIDNFIETEYTWFLPTYRSYPYQIQRVDSARYFILYHYGGMFIDLDIGCNMSMPDILSNAFAYNVLVVATYPTGVSNQIVMTTKEHPLFRDAIYRLSKTNKWYGTPYVTVMWSTGPMFLTQLLSKDKKMTDIFILPREEVFTKYFWRVQGGSWHTQWDSKVFVAAGEIFKTNEVIKGALLCLSIASLFFVAFTFCYKWKNTHSSWNCSGSRFSTCLHVASLVLAYILWPL